MFRSFLHANCEFVISLSSWYKRGDTVQTFDIISFIFLVWNVSHVLQLIGWRVFGKVVHVCGCGCGSVIGLGTALGSVFHSPYKGPLGPVDRPMTFSLALILISPSESYSQGSDTHVRPAMTLTVLTPSES